ncbi:MAG: tetratricopeptide repeat protein [Candidatus Margulisbacteria bacterium]|nr:tetratricopeptide repeat protein [Candidatus Margulisiibacteriota bacterium]
MIEKGTSYAFLVEKLLNPTFDRIRDIANTFTKQLQADVITELHDMLNRGADLIENEPQMLMYLRSFGPMHQAKLMNAFDHLPDAFFKNTIEIIDYGCGQAIGEIVYADFLLKKRLTQKVKCITLIEPSEYCLKRAALHVHKFFPDAEIRTVCKYIDDLTSDDIYTNENLEKLHVFSNILDIEAFDLYKLVNLIKEKCDSFNQFVCVSPFPLNTERLDQFAELMGGKMEYNQDFPKGSFKNGKDWSCAIRLFCIGDENKNSLGKSIEGLKIEYINKLISVKLFYKTSLLGKLSDNDFDGIRFIKDFDNNKHLAKECIENFQIYKLSAAYRNPSEKKIWDKAVSCYKNAALDGEIEAYNNLGILFNYAGEDELSFDFFMLGAKGGSTNAMFNISVAYFSGSNDKFLNDEKYIYWTKCSAEVGNLTAIFNLAVCYQFGIHTNINLELAVKYYMSGLEIKAEDSSDRYLQEKISYNLALMSYYGFGMQQNYKKAVDIFLKLSLPDAKNVLGVCYALGNGVDPDIKKAIDFFKQAVIIETEPGRKVAQYNLGVCNEEGYGISIDKKCALDLYTKSATYGPLILQDGYVFAQYKMGLIYHYGEFVTKDIEKAFGWFSKAAEQGYAGAQLYLGLYYEEGLGVTKNYVKAIEFYNKAAEQGYTDAYFRLGNCYKDGIILKQDFKKAVEFFIKGEEFGCDECKEAINYDKKIKRCPKCQNSLGMCYLYGKGVEQNYFKSVEWFIKAANQGFEKAQINLGIRYYTGEGVKKDFKKAVDLFIKLAEKGDVYAQYHLGICYIIGDALTQNLPLAKKWLTIAAKQEFEPAKKVLSKINN